MDSAKEEKEQVVIGSISVNGLIPTGPTVTAQQMFIKSKDPFKPVARAEPITAVVQEANSCRDKGALQFGPTGAHEPRLPSEPGSLLPFRTLQFTIHPLPGVRCTNKTREQACPCSPNRKRQNTSLGQGGLSAKGCPS